MTPQASHTPGPWMYHFEEPNREWALIMAGGKAGQIVANVNTESSPDSQSAPAFRVMPAEANARLIAAAPELLSICFELLHDPIMQLHRYQHEGCNLCAIVRAAEQAVKQATATA